VHNPFGPWATTIDFGPQTRLSTFWRRRLTRLPTVSRSDPPVGLLTVLALLATAAALVGVPTLQRRADATKPADAKAGQSMAIQALDKIRSVSFTLTSMEVKDGRRTTTQVVKCKALRSGQRRGESNSGEIQIYDESKGRFLMLSPKEKRATVQSLYPPAGASEGHAEDLMQALREMLSAMPATLAEKEVDGRKVVQFASKLHGREVLVSLDAATRLPMRIEWRQKLRSPGIESEVVEAMHDFQFNVAMDPSLFATDPPPGYQVQWLTHAAGAEGQAREDAQRLVVSPRSGIGPVKFNMSKADVVRLLGRPDGIERREETQLPPGVAVRNPAEGKTLAAASVVEMLSYSSRGFQIEVNGWRGKGVTSIRCTSRAEGGSLVRDFAGKTAEGLRLGASWEDMIRMYGRPESVFRGANVLADYPRLGWEFFFQENRLRGINVSPLGNEVAPKPLSLDEQARRIARALKIYAEAGQSHYPPEERLNAGAVSHDLVKMLGLREMIVTNGVVEKAVGTEGMTEKAASVAKFSDASAGFQRLFEIQFDNPDFAYHGNTVGPRDKDKVLLRWKRDDGQNEVIYGDLHDRTVAHEK